MNVCCDLIPLDFEFLKEFFLCCALNPCLLKDIKMVTFGCEWKSRYCLPCLACPRCGALLGPQLVMPAYPLSCHLSPYPLSAMTVSFTFNFKPTAGRCAHSPLALQHPTPCSLLPIPSPVFVFPLSPSSPLSAISPSAVKASALEKSLSVLLQEVQLYSGRLESF